jgi:hypothetical protein
MLISGNPSEALSTALQIENENNGLIGGFGVPNGNLPSKKKPSLMSAFDEEVEDPNQLSLIETEEVIVYEEPAKKPINTSMDFSEEEIELMLEEESRKALKNFTEPIVEPIELFPSEDDEPEDSDIMGWFSTPKE